VRRSERLIRVTKWLVDRPNHAVPLSDLASCLDAAKSSLSEDVAMVREVLEQDEAGTVATIQGASGGVRYEVRLPHAERRLFLTGLVARLSEPSRVLPGGFVYMSDILGDPDVLDFVGRAFAQTYANQGVNVVVTVETKGIPLAVATARYLHVPVVVVRREHRVTDGSAVSVHYVSGSERRIQTMSISKRAMPSHARALVVDDFMRAGATAKAVVRLLAEFEADVAGIAIFVETEEPRVKLVDHYISLFSLGTLEEGKEVKIAVSDRHPFSGS
jgi:purine operon repressor